MYINYMLCSCLFQIAANEKKAHENWVSLLIYRSVFNLHDHLFKSAISVVQRVGCGPKLNFFFLSPVAL